MSDRVSPVVAEALDRVVSDNGWLAASRPGPLRASLSDVLGQAADQHRAELDAVVVSAEEGIPSRLRTAGRAAAQGLVPELTRRLVDWGMAEGLASSVVETWAGLVPEISSSAPVVDDKPTVVSQPREQHPAPPVEPAEPAEPAEPVGDGGTPAATPPVEPASASPSHAAPPRSSGRGRTPVWIAGAVAVAVVIAAGAWLGLHNRGDDSSPLLAMLTDATGPAQGLVPTNACTATDAHAVCTKPSSAITSLDLRTYPDMQTLYREYETEAGGLRGEPLQVNVGDCNSHHRSGEVSWNHDFQHPKVYSIDDHMTMDLMQNGKAEGRMACAYSGSFMTIVWTDDCGNLLGRIQGPVMGLFATWKALHHNIVPPDCTPMEMGGGDMPSSPSSPSSSDGMGDMG